MWHGREKCSLGKPNMLFPLLKNRLLRIYETSVNPKNPRHSSWHTVGFLYILTGRMGAPTDLPYGLNFGHWGRLLLKPQVNFWDETQRQLCPPVLSSVTCLGLWHLKEIRSPWSGKGWWTLQTEKMFKGNLTWTGGHICLPLLIRRLTMCSQL